MSRTAKVRVKSSGDGFSGASETEAAAANTASNEIVRKASKTATVDANGVLVTVRKLSPLQRMRLSEILGSAASIPSYVGPAAVAASVCSIDGEPIPFPTSKREVEAIVQRLDEDGMETASMALAELMGIALDGDGNILADGVEQSSSNRAKLLATAKN